MVWSLRSFRHYANGITWDPRGKYLVTVSTDRRLDILDAVKGTRLRCCYRVDIPNVLDAENRIVQQVLYFHELMCFEISSIKLAFVFLRVTKSFMTINCIRL